MSAKKNCAVVIPMYKTSVTPLEQIALAQCKRILADYDVIVVKPEQLNLADCNADLSFIRTEISFKDNYFNGISGYNALMMSAEFYGAFPAYEYILIYQLDAFVFKDNLKEWCNGGWDYIGAPWFRKKQFNGTFKRFKERIRCYVHRRYNLLNADGLPDSERQMTNQVGNGGLSLRKADRFQELCIAHQDLIRHYLEQKTSHYNEDIFWSIALNRKTKTVRIPPFEKALHFAIETEPERAFKKVQNELPFGCHAWDKNLSFWRPYIEAAGYTI